MKFIILLILLNLMVIYVSSHKEYFIKIEAGDDLEIEEFSFKGKAKNQNNVPAVFGNPPQPQQQVQPSFVQPEPLPANDVTTLKPETTTTTSALLPAKKKEAGATTEETDETVEEQQKKK